ncbi:Coq4 family protein [Nannocystis punicea]|uniref:Coq4 family protein n=1 Tax=Nannocystis punicea TaxID=2995304 RepID=A0ABY7H5N7_9BACT|nr:Coq4 family protein [Nannocystis poenicansa]WAS94507.1 Coq4 family protein [Nannocystis poenicansa]
MPSETPSWWARLRQLRALRAEPSRIGDAAVLQSDLLGARMREEVRAQVAALCARSDCDRLRLRLDHAALRRSPPGTFGRAYADFCAANAIVPATISDAFDDDTLRHNAAIARYICLHDMFHVLLGCDTSIPGELRITAFILEQRYFRAGAALLALLALAGPLLRPHQFREILKNVRIGRDLARRAPLLLAEPLEDWLAHDLAAVQQRLGLPATV